LIKLLLIIMLTGPFSGPPYIGLYSRGGSVAVTCQLSLSFLAHNET